MNGIFSWVEEQNILVWSIKCSYLWKYPEEGDLRWEILVENLATDCRLETHGREGDAQSWWGLVCGPEASECNIQMDGICSVLQWLLMLPSSQWDFYLVLSVGLYLCGIEMTEWAWKYESKEWAKVVTWMLPFVSSLETGPIALIICLSLERRDIFLNPKFLFGSTSSQDD